EIMAKEGTRTGINVGMVARLALRRVDELTKKIEALEKIVGTAK
ncbi:unnamed protein product, partial [marine sediment metagenome]